MGFPLFPFLAGPAHSLQGVPAALSPSPEPPDRRCLATGEEHSGGDQPAAASFAVILSSSSVSKFPFWLRCFSLQVVILLPGSSLPAEQMPARLPAPLTLNRWVW